MCTGREVDLVKIGLPIPSALMVIAVILRTFSSADDLKDQDQINKRYATWVGCPSLLSRGALKRLWRSYIEEAVTLRFLGPRERESLNLLDKSQFQALRQQYMMSVWSLHQMYRP